MLKRLYNRVFVCPKWGHRPGSPARGTYGYLNDHCAMCGGYLYPKRKAA